MEQRTIVFLTPFDYFWFGQSFVSGVPYWDCSYLWNYGRIHYTGDYKIDFTERWANPKLPSVWCRYNVCPGSGHYTFGWSKEIISQYQYLWLSMVTSKCSRCSSFEIQNCVLSNCNKIVLTSEIPYGLKKYIWCFGWVYPPGHPDLKFWYYLDLPNTNSYNYICKFAGILLFVQYCTRYYSVSGEGLAPIVKAYSRLILVDGLVLWAIIHVCILLGGAANVYLFLKLYSGAFLGRKAQKSLTNVLLVNKHLEVR